MSELFNRLICEWFHGGAKLADAAGFFGTSVQTLENTYLQYHPDFQAGTAAIMDGKG